MTTTHGEIEPIAYLCAWNSMGGDVSRSDHQDRHFVPSDELVADWVERIRPFAGPLLAWLARLG